MQLGPEFVWEFPYTWSLIVYNKVRNSSYSRVTPPEIFIWPGKAKYGQYVGKNWLTCKY